MVGTSELHYKVYGLHLVSNGLIPGLVPLPSVGSPDVHVYLQKAPPWLHGALKLQELVYSSPDEDEQGTSLLTVRKLLWDKYFRLSYSDATEFIVDRGGNQIWCTWPAEFTSEDTATYLLGPVLGFVLRLKGRLCLHASAFAHGGRVIALLGDTGTGKSTTVAALAQQGYRVLSDDIVVISNGGQSYWVQPGYPRLRLWPESADALFGSSKALSRLAPSWDKCYLDLTQKEYHFLNESSPLAAIYLLCDRTHDPAAPLVETVSDHQALIDLITNTYANYLLDKSMRAHEFECLGGILNKVPFRRVRPHAESAYLSRLCDVILEDFESLSLSA